MRWNITDMLVSPKTGTAFAVARTLNNKAITVWYKGDYFLRPGNTLLTEDKGIIVDGKLHEFKMIHTMPYFPSIWKTLKNGCCCPGNDNITLRECDNQQNCLFKLCPYGIKKLPN